MLNETAAEYLDAIGQILTEGNGKSYTVEAAEYGPVLVAELPSPMIEDGKAGYCAVLKQADEGFVLIELRLTLLFGVPQELWEDILLISEEINRYLTAGSFRLEKESGTLYVAQGVLIDGSAGKDAAAFNILKSFSVMENAAVNSGQYFIRLIEGGSSAEELLSELREL